MRIEHIALNVPDPVGMANWYVKYCGFVVRKALTEPPFTHFISERDGEGMIELYDRTDKRRWTASDFADPLFFHLALTSIDLFGDSVRLCIAGASEIERTIDADGYGLVMLRDPFGMALQLCRRREPLT